MPPVRLVLITAILVPVWTLVLAAVLSSAPLAAANFWDTTEFSAWSTSEVAKMLTTSPWARRFSILTPDFSLARRVGGLTGGVVGNGGRGARSSGGGVAGDGAGNLGGGSFMASPDRTPIVVRWNSALPVRQALVRERQANVDVAGPPPPHLDAVDPFYRIAVVGLPFTQEVGSRDELQSVTWLRRKDKAMAPMQAVSVSFEYESEAVDDRVRLLEGGADSRERSGDRIRDEAGSDRGEDEVQAQGHDRQRAARAVKKRLGSSPPLALAAIGGEMGVPTRAASRRGRPARCVSGPRQTVTLAP